MPHRPWALWRNDSCLIHFCTSLKYWRTVSHHGKDIELDKQGLKPRFWSLLAWARLLHLYNVDNIHLTQKPKAMEKAREFQKNIYFCFINYAKAFDYVDNNKLWKILQEMGIPDHFRNLCRSRNNRSRHGTTDWFQIGKGVCQGCVLSPCLFNLNAVKHRALH